MPALPGTREISHKLEVRVPKSCIVGKPEPDPSTRLPICGKDSGGSQLDRALGGIPRPRQEVNGEFSELPHRGWNE